MSKIEIVLEQKLSLKELEQLLSVLDETISKIGFTVSHAGAVDAPTVRDCSKEVCNIEE